MDKEKKYIFADFLDRLDHSRRNFDAGQRPDRKYEFDGPPLDPYRHRDLMIIALDAVHMLDWWRCFTCGQNTGDGEDFYVHDDLWSTYGVEGMLCIGCLETRLGRKLVPEDFKDGFRDAVVRDDCGFGWSASDRLKDRLGL